MTGKATPLIPRILARIERVERGYESACWIFTGALSRGGYGMVSGPSPTDKRTMLYVHRVTYEHFIGLIAEGLQVDHLCKVRECCNPAHLEAVSQAENIRRGDSPSAMASRTDLCKRGHELSEENTELRQSGRRQCRTCINEGQRRRRRARAA